MEHGDLAASDPVPQAYVVLEGLVLIPGPAFTQKRFAWRVRTRRYDSALSLLAYNHHAMAALWNLWMASRPVCLITYLPATMLPAIRRSVDENSVPHVRTIQVTEKLMAHTIALRRDALMVFDADPERALLYGPKGRIIRPEQAEMMERCL